MILVKQGDPKDEMYISRRRSANPSFNSSLSEKYRQENEMVELKPAETKIFDRVPSRQIPVRK